MTHAARLMPSVGPSGGNPGVAGDPCPGPWLSFLPPQHRQPGPTSPSLLAIFPLRCPAPLWWPRRLGGSPSSCVHCPGRRTQPGSLLQPAPPVGDCDRSAVPRRTSRPFLERNSDLELPGRSGLSAPRSSQRPSLRGLLPWYRRSSYEPYLPRGKYLRPSWSRLGYHVPRYAQRSSLPWAIRVRVLVASGDEQYSRRFTPK